MIAATLKDWDWGMGVNFWGPLCGVRTFVPRKLARKEGCHIVTTSSRMACCSAAAMFML